MSPATAERAGVTIGGSSAAAACGIDPHRSRLMLWCELTGRIRRTESEAMEWGSRLEPTIIKSLGRDYGYAVAPWGEPSEVCDELSPWLVGHPDGVCYFPDDVNGLLEVKTAGQWTAREWEGDGAPIPYIAQVQVYLHLTGFTRCLLACLVGGQKLELREIERDDRAVSRLLVLMEHFMGYVERDEPPPIDDSASTREALSVLHARSDGSAVRLMGDEWRAYRELVARREQRDAIEAQITGLENRLKARMGDAETAVSPFDEPVLHWRTVASTRLDAKRVKSEFPDVYEACKHTTEARRFTVG
jgi:putative phage-type endonuclease